MRASAVAEKAGVRSASIVATGFLQQAKAVAQALGLKNMSVAEYPGVIMNDSKEELQKKVAEVLLDNVIKGLTTPVEKAVKPVEPGLRDIVFKGTLDEVQEFFTENLWTDGLPVIPPTIERIEQFLKFTERPSNEIVGVLLPEKREATVWNIAANGVMAGCRPEYMPVLIAVVEAISDHEFRIEDAGSTPGWEPLIILNGPIIKELDFNYGSGVMRVGRQPNTSIGRFLRLYMRNIAGLRIPPGQTDKGSIAGSFNVVLAENEDAVSELGWKPFSVERGFQPGENVVTVQSALYSSCPAYSGGHTAGEHLETIAEIIGRGTAAHWSFTGVQFGKYYPLVVVSPSVAKIIARDGGSKDTIKQYLYKNVKARAGLLEKLAWQVGLSSFSYAACVEQGIIPGEYYESKDPDRLVPVFINPQSIGIVVSGDPGRNQNKGYIQNHEQGAPVSRRIRLPSNWATLLKESQAKRSVYKKKGE